MKIATCIITMFFSFCNAADSLNLGSTAPNITIKNQNNEDVSLQAAAQAQDYLLVYFYPKADTPGCTKQGCSLRDHFAELTDLGVQVIGVSIDSVKKQKAFAEKYNLPFTLLADTEKTAIKAFGVDTYPAVGMAHRQAYLFKNSKLIWKDESAPTKTQAQQILKVVKAL